MQHSKIFLVFSIKIIAGVFFWVSSILNFFGLAQTKDVAIELFSFLVLNKPNIYFVFYK